MKVIIVSHPDRAAYVARLQECLDVVTTVVDTVNARSGHRAALAIAAQHDERVAIMEDDAIPSRFFHALSDVWAMKRPDDLVSFYLGTGYPRQFQPMIDQRIQQADNDGNADIWLPTLIHGVCYSLPRATIPETLNRMDMLHHIGQADYAIGAAWGRPVCYPIESLVQHRDTTPVERHPDGLTRKVPRVARRLAEPLMFNPT